VVKKRKTESKPAITPKAQALLTAVISLVIWAIISPIFVLVKKELENKSRCLNSLFLKSISIK